MSSSTYKNRYKNRYEKRILKNLHETCFICYENKIARIITNVCDCKSFIHEHCLTMVMLNISDECRTCGKVYFSQKNNIKKRRTIINKLMRLAIEDHINQNTLIGYSDIMHKLYPIILVLSLYHLIYIIYYYGQFYL